MSVVDRFPFAAQILIWGAVFSGDVAEHSAVVSESRHGGYLPERSFDHDRAYLRTIVVYDQSGPLPVPDWWALPWVSAWARQQT